MDSETASKLFVVKVRPSYSGLTISDQRNLRLAAKPAYFREAFLAVQDFKKSPVKYFVSRCRLVGRLSALILASKSWTRKTRSWKELIDFTFEAAGGFLRPLQIKAEIEQAMTEVEKVKPRFILEIGTANGGTFFLFSRAAAAKALIISLDLPAGRWGGGYSGWKTGIFRRLLLQGQSAQFVRADSHSQASMDQVKQALGGNQLDLLFIDGDHSYEGVKKDYEMYSSLLRPHGVIVFHDVALHDLKHECYVDQLWTELKGKYSHSEIIQDPKQGWAGIGILYT